MTPYGCDVFFKATGQDGVEAIYRTDGSGYKVYAPSAAMVPDHILDPLRRMVANTKATNRAVIGLRDFDAKMKSDGRYEVDGFKNSYNAIAKSNHDAIEIFAALAITNGVDWEVVLEALGYEPLLVPSDAAKGWLNDPT
jgi:hypothetical protein